VSQINNKKLVEQIARKIKSLREECGLSQEVVYHDTGIHIGRIETGRSNVTVSTLDAICTYFDTDLATFFAELKKI
jgi:transcriptional regulator with XRE-family HTH domain